MRRRELIALLGGAEAAWPLSATAQDRDRVPRIGVLWTPFAATDPEVKRRMPVFQRALQDLGWMEGRNVKIEYRFSSGEAIG
jgi:putative ABC transport system substrate-binding protein